LSLITLRAIPKGDVFSCSRIAGIIAAQKTHELIPMCHPMTMEGISIGIAPEAPDKVRSLATIKYKSRTEIEINKISSHYGNNGPYVINGNDYFCLYAVESAS
jgi:cyclic pyranopterin monophosphate synthase